jgi:hypothetical protein
MNAQPSRILPLPGALLSFAQKLGELRSNEQNVDICLFAVALLRHVQISLFLIETKISTSAWTVCAQFSTNNRALLDWTVGLVDWSKHRTVLRID